jgi:hypothetical protein
MEVAIYSDFEPRKPKSRKKREPAADLLESNNLAVEPEQNLEKASQRIEEAPAEHPGWGQAKCEEVKRVKVIRVPANPRLLICGYEENGCEHQVRVFVGRNGNFRPNMEISVRRGASQTEMWVYEGKMPRFGGRW